MEPRTGGPRAIGSAEIARRVPHAGSMCLLDRVMRCDESGIVCRARSPRYAEHPLRHEGRLAAVVAAEYASQAIALHGSLLAPSDAPPRAGFLARLSELELGAVTLDCVDAPLTVVATRIAQSDDACSYGFEVSAGDRMLARGRALIALA